MKKIIGVGLAAVLVLAFAAMFFAGGSITGEAVAPPTFLQKIFGTKTAVKSPADLSGVPPADKLVETAEETGFVCGNGNCATGYGETTINCPQDCPAAPIDDITISVFYKSTEVPYKVKLYKRFHHDALGLLTIEGSKDNFMMDAAYRDIRESTGSPFLSLTLRNSARNAKIKSSWGIVNNELSALGNIRSSKENDELLIQENGKSIGSSFSEQTVAFSNGVSVITPNALASTDTIRLNLLDELKMELHTDADLSDASYDSMEKTIHFMTTSPIIHLTGGDFEKSVKEAWILVEAPVFGSYENA